MRYKLKLERYFPLGIDYYQELKWICGGLALSFLYSIGYFVKLSNSYDDLFRWIGTKKILINGAEMIDFILILRGSLVGFIIVALCMIALSIYHYMYHYLGSKSIYLMKRLPNRFDLWKRCLISPLIAIVISFVFAFILLVVYYWVYMIVTPQQCLTPGQWQKIWIYILGAIV